MPRLTRQIARGPRKLFSENLDHNLEQLSTRLPDPNLTLEKFSIGTRTNRPVAITFLRDVANPGIVGEIRRRLGAVRAETILDGSYIERDIQDSALSPFPQLEKTGRPDALEAALLQGRAGILVEGSPDVLIAPATFFDLLDTPDDAYRRWFVASSFFRVARFILFLLASFLPAFYIALTSYNPELIPTSLLLMMAVARDGSPFPIYLEAFLMMGVAEAVRMVMLRMPTAVGQTIALFTGLTLVGAGLEARFFGAATVIVATLSVLASFAIPDFDLRSSIRMVQFGTMLMATVLGVRRDTRPDQAGKPRQGTKGSCTRNCCPGTGEYRDGAEEVPYRLPRFWQGVGRQGSQEL